MKKNKCCNNGGCNNSQPIEIITPNIVRPYPKKRNKIERFLDRYNHMMEFIRTVFALTTIILQLIILSRIL